MIAPGAAAAEQSSPPLAPDLDQARAFLGMLDQDGAEFTFQAFDDAGLGRGDLAKIVHGALDDHADRLTAWNSRSAGIFTTVNETDGLGRKAENIVRVRAVFTDLDGAPLGPVLQCHLEPHLIVETSPGRWHCYWLVEDLPLDQFQGVQKAIAARFAGDASVHDLSRVMRLPGYWHRKAEPFLVRIHGLSDRPPYTAERILAEFPPGAGAKPNGQDYSNGHDRGMAEITRRILSGEEFHDALRDLAFRYVKAGMAPGQVVETLRGLMEATPDDARDSRWHARRAEIPRLVGGAEDKLRGHVDFSGLLDKRRDNRDNRDNGDKPAPVCLTPAQWAAREIEPEDLLLGSLFSTTSRSQLSADTGLGKTMTAIAIAFAIRLGCGFLHWEGHRPARVLYLDGEMPRELIQARLAAAASWFGLDAPIDDGLFVQSHEDDETMAPLDTPKGADWLFALIERLGGVDFIIFDNIASLTVGVLKDEESAIALKDLQRALTRQRIGQLWLHHTGHDQSRGYGSKTREWWLDTVMVAEKLDQPTADVAFTLKFPKCRRRTPDNRMDFEETEVVLELGQWSSASPAPKRSDSAKATKQNDNSTLCLRALRKALAEFGTQPPHCSETAKVEAAVTLDQWRSVYKCVAPYDDEQAEARKKAFQRGVERLVAGSPLVVGSWGGWYWLK